MKNGNDFVKQPENSNLLKRRILTGGGIALILMGIFLSQVDNPNPAWGRSWMLKPLIFIALGGAFGGGAFHYITNYMGYKKDWFKVCGLIIGLIVFIVALWLSSVLGLDGTLWD